MESLVSICIPTYNQVSFLKRTMESLCIQTYKNFEVVVSDDSTTDEVSSLVKEYEQKLRIVYHRNSVPLGSPKNWNKAMDMATGELIKIIHHDDWLASESSLEEFVKVFGNNKCDFAFCDSEILNVKEGTTSFNVPSSSFLQKLNNNPKILFTENRIGSPTAVMFRRTEIRFDEKMKFLVDFDFYITLLSKNQHFIYIPKPLIVNTSNHSGQVTASSMDKKTQVCEHSYLYNKLFRGSVPGKNISLHFIRIFRSHKIRNYNEIEQLGCEKPVPKWYFKFLILLSKI
jgi:glycosyltransferase involved in cell wall biosynthesis